MFGECGILDDGRRVLAPWNAGGVYIGDRFFPGPQVRMPDAVLDASGRAWVVGKAQADIGPMRGALVLCESVGDFWPIVNDNGASIPAFGARCVIRADGAAGVRVGIASGSHSWASVAVESLTGITRRMHVAEIGTIADGSGANGLRGWSEVGRPLPMLPLDESLLGYPVRGASTLNAGVQIGAALGPVPDSVLVARGMRVGTLQSGGVDWQGLRLSANGKYWAGVQYVGGKVHGGAVPELLDPVKLTPILKACATAWIFAFGRYGHDPSAPSDWTIVVDDDTPPPDRPFLIARLADKTSADLILKYAPVWERVAGIFITNENGRDLQLEADRAIGRMDALRLPRKPLLSYTGKSVDAAIAVKEIRWIGIECYLDAVHGESLLDAEHRWRNEIQKAMSARRAIAIIGGASGDGGRTIAQLQRLMLRYFELARVAGAELLIWFAWGRALGGRALGLGQYAESARLATTPIPVPAGTWPPAPPPPIPPPVDEGKPKMTFAESLALTRQCAAKWRTVYGKTDQEMDEGQAHIWLWRMLVEGWSAEAILADIYKR